MKHFFKRVLGKMILVFLSVNILFSLLLTGRIFSIFQIIGLRGWDDRLLTVIGAIIFFVKQAVKKISF